MALKYHALLRGVFIYRSADTKYFLKRDKTVAANVLDSQAPAFGLLGSDAFYESPDSRLDTEVLLPIINAAGKRLRFAVATPEDGASIKTVKKKIEAGEPIKIGTSYPNTAVREMAALGIAIMMNPKCVQEGCAEGLPEQYPDDCEAIFELVQSGDSLVENGLKTLIDDIAPANLLRVEARVMQ